MKAAAAILLAALLLPVPARAEDFSRPNAAAESAEKNFRAAVARTREQFLATFEKTYGSNRVAAVTAPHVRNFCRSYTPSPDAFPASPALRALWLTGGSDAPLIDDLAAQLRQQAARPIGPDGLPAARAALIAAVPDAPPAVAQFLAAQLRANYEPNPEPARAAAPKVSNAAAGSALRAWPWWLVPAVILIFAGAGAWWFAARRRMEIILPNAAIRRASESGSDWKQRALLTEMEQLAARLEQLGGAQPKEYYEARIAELERELASKAAENRALLQARIEVARQQMAEAQSRVELN